MLLVSLGPFKVKLAVRGGSKFDAVKRTLLLWRWYSRSDLLGSRLYPTIQFS